MLVVLDTTVFGSDPMCASDAWGVLVHAAEAWGLKIVVPSVVLLEAVGGYQRSLVELQTAVEGWTEKKRFTGLGLAAAADDLEMSIYEASEGYADRLSGILADLNAIIAPLPNVPHSVLVERAVSRRKPCDSSGDGYRDTLNWLTVLELLKEYPDDDLYWVSNNTGDFGADSTIDSGHDPNPAPAALHQELQEELATAGFSDRVKYAHELRHMVSDLAATLAPELPQDMRNLRSQLRVQTLTRFVAQEVLPGVAPMGVDPRDCALPIETINADLLAVGELTDFDFVIRGSMGGDEALIDFRITGVSELILELAADQQVYRNAKVSPDGQFAEVQISKQLVFRGFLTTNSVGKPLSGEIARIVSTPEDPARTAWREKDARDRARTSTETATLWRNFRPTIDSKMFEALTPQFNTRFAELMKAISPDPGMPASLKPSTVIDQKILASLTPPTMDPDVLAYMRRMATDPAVLRAIREASAARRGPEDETDVAGEAAPDHRSEDEPPGDDGSPDE